MKYNKIEEWEDLKKFYKYKNENPNSDKKFYDINKKIDVLRNNGEVKIKGTAVKPDRSVKINKYNEHTLMRMQERNITKKDIQNIKNNSIVAFKQRNGNQYAYYSENGFVVIDINGMVGSVGWVDENAKKFISEVLKDG